MRVSLLFFPSNWQTFFAISKVKSMKLEKSKSIFDKMVLFRSAFHKGFVKTPNSMKYFLKIPLLQLAVAPHPSCERRTVCTRELETKGRVNDRTKSREILVSLSKLRFTVWRHSFGKVSCFELEASQRQRPVLVSDLLRFFLPDQFIVSQEPISADTTTIHRKSLSEKSSTVLRVVRTFLFSLVWTQTFLTHWLIDNATVFLEI